MLITVQFPIFDARGLQGTRSTRLAKPTWPFPVAGQQFVRRFGGIIFQRAKGLTGFFSEERVCQADKALRLSDTPHAPKPIAFRQLFADGDVLVKFEVGFLLPNISAAKQCKKQVFSTLVGDLLSRKVLIGEPDHCDEVLLSHAGKPVAALYCRSTTHRPRTVWSKLRRVFKSHNDLACFAGQPLVSVNIVSPTAETPLFGRVLDFGNAFLWTWDQKVADQRIKVVVIGERAHRTSDLARNLRLFINRIHAELLANEYGLTAVDAELRRALTPGEVSEAIRKLHTSEMRITALIRRIERSISALCRRRSVETKIPEVHTVLETIWDWRVDTVLDRYELLRERAARVHATFISSSIADGARADVLSAFSGILSPPLGVFISYRRDDTRDLAGRISDFLERGEFNFRIFRDLGSIEPGSDWRSEIERGIRQAHLVLVILGPNWAGRSASGRLRIADTEDWVRYELESAFKLKKDIIPVVLHGTNFPPKDLPGNLRPLTRIQPFMFDPSSGFDQSMTHLVKILQSFQGGRHHRGAAQ